MNTQTANWLLHGHNTKMLTKYKICILFLIGIMCFTFTSCSDQGSKYIGRWERLDGQETIEIRKNDKSYILEVGNEGRFTGSIQSDGILDISVGPMQTKISIDNRSGNLLLGGQGEYRRVSASDIAARARADSAKRNAQNICSITSASMAAGFRSESWKSVRDAVNQVRKGYMVDNMGPFKIDGLSDADAEAAMAYISQNSNGGLQYTPK